MAKTKPIITSAEPAADINAPYTIGILDRHGNWQEINGAMLPIACYGSLAEALKNAPAVIGGGLDIVVRDVAGRIAWRQSEAK